MGQSATRMGLSSASGSENQVFKLEVNVSLAAAHTNPAFGSNEESESAKTVSDNRVQLPESERAVFWLSTYST